MMDIVIPYKHEPGEVALTYALRSLTGHRIIIIGDKPKTLSGYYHIPCGDKIGPQYKEANIFRKLLKACNDGNVSDPFVYSMDDIFFLQPPANENYYQKDLAWKIDDIRIKGRDNPYRKTMQQTLTALTRAGYGITHYDIHGPTVIHKAGFENLTKFDWKKDWSYGIRSMYGNVNNIGGISIADCKIDTPHRMDELTERIEGRRFFSIGDKINPTLKMFLQNIFPIVSEFELP